MTLAYDFDLKDWPHLSKMIKGAQMDSYSIQLLTRPEDQLLLRRSGDTS